jgi:hypothetical protein
MLKNLIERMDRYLATNRPYYNAQLRLGGGTQSWKS